MILHAALAFLLVSTVHSSCNHDCLKEVAKDREADTYLHECRACKTLPLDAAANCPTTGYDCDPTITLTPNVFNADESCECAELKCADAETRLAVDGIIVDKVRCRSRKWNASLTTEATSAVCTRKCGSECATLPDFIYNGLQLFTPIVNSPNADHGCPWAVCEHGAFAWDDSKEKAVKYEGHVDFSCGGDGKWRLSTGEKHVNIMCKICLPGFRVLPGLEGVIWCLKLSEEQYHFDDAMKYCEAVGVHTPSMHSEADIDFWRTSLNDEMYHFWTDAFCKDAGQTYIWGDGTPTDYLGPKNELANCRVGVGYHMHPTGLDDYEFDVSANALCAYRVGEEPILTSARSRMAVVPSPPQVLPAIENSVCDPATVSLDIAFVVDTSAAMTNIEEVSSTMQSLLAGLTHGTDEFQSNVAVIAYADTVQAVRDFGAIKNTEDVATVVLPTLGGGSTKLKDAVDQATAKLTQNARTNSRRVVVVISNSFDKLAASNIASSARSLKNDGIIIITIDYNRSITGGLERLASPGYYINAAVKSEQIVDEMQTALCDANRSCPEGKQEAVARNEYGREQPVCAN